MSWRAWVCPHYVTSFTDEKGKAICLECGTVVTTHPADALQEIIDRIRGFTGEEKP